LLQLREQSLCSAADESDDAMINGMGLVTRARVLGNTCISTAGVSVARAQHWGNFVRVTRPRPRGEIMINHDYR